MKLKVLRPVAKKFPVSSPFGMRKHPQTGKQKMHNGVDFAVPTGTVVRSMTGGFCFRSGWEDTQDAKKGFGLRIWQESIIDGEEYYLWYGHLNQSLAVDFAPISAGEVIGMSGDTGSSSGPHLHVQARKKNTGKFFDLEFNDV